MVDESDEVIFDEAVKEQEDDLESYDLEDEEDIEKDESEEE